MASRDRARSPAALLALPAAVASSSGRMSTLHRDRPGAPSTAQERRFADRGEAIYQALRDALELSHPAGVVAIEVESGEYFVAGDELPAYRAASANHPDRQFYFRSIGPRRLPLRTAPRRT